MKNQKAYGLCVRVATAIDRIPSAIADKASALNLSRDLLSLLDTEDLEAGKDVAPKLTGDLEIDAMLRDCISTFHSKGDEYTIGSKDRLANFREAGKDVDMPMEKAWFIFFNKHLRALQSYIKNGRKVKSNETIHSRIMDCVVYLLLFEKMTQEFDRNDEKLSTVPIAHHPV